MMKTIDYKINTATKENLLLHLEKCNHRFTPPLSERVELDEYAEKLNNFATTFEAWCQSELVGVISVYLNDEKKQAGFISNVSVLADFEKKGIAGTLLVMAKENASRLSFPSLSLEVSLDNTNAIKFYERHGFERVSNNDNDTLFMNCSIN